MSTLDLKIKSVIGFSGQIHGGLRHSPDGKYAVYPLGSFLVLKNLKSGKEAFLNGHSGDISCVALSHDGATLATGQSNLPGVKVC